MFVHIYIRSCDRWDSETPPSFESVRATEVPKYQTCLKLGIKNVAFQWDFLGEKKHLWCHLTSVRFPCKCGFDVCSLSELIKTASEPDWCGEWCVCCTALGYSSVLLEAFAAACHSALFDVWYGNTTFLDCLMRSLPALLCLHVPAGMLVSPWRKHHILWSTVMCWKLHCANNKYKPTISFSAQSAFPHSFNHLRHITVNTALVLCGRMDNITMNQIWLVRFQEKSRQINQGDVWALFYFLFYVFTWSAILWKHKNANVRAS